MKRLSLVLCALVLVVSSGFLTDTKGETFEEKTNRYYELSKTDYFKALIAIPEDETAPLSDKDELINSLKFLEGSTIEELRTLFEVEISADGCYWVTVSDYCFHCRHSLFNCGIFTPVKPCIKRQLEYCGSYWSGRERTSNYNRCC
ncbi:hypothetical protein ACJD0Z_09380 [Flavobacteriaceae bacterium M23B6Z8]